MTEPLFERLVPAGAPAGAVELLSELQPGDHAPPDRPRVLVNMVATIDGRIEIGGRSGPIGNPADQDLFHALRTRVDAAR